MKNLGRLQFIYILCHLLLPLAVYRGDGGWWAYAALWYFILQVLGVGIAIHRLVAHNSFPTHPLVYKALTLIGCLSCIGSPMGWAGVHRFHHSNADQEQDPHDPTRLTLWEVISGKYYREVRIPMSYMRDMAVNPWLRHLHENYFLILAAYAGVLLLINVDLFLFQFVVPVTLVYWANTLGVFLNHSSWGYRNFDTPDHSVNSWILSFYTLGDGWHNNHHRHPNNYSHKVKWWEFDTCALLIDYIFRSGSGAKPSNLKLPTKG